MLFLETLVLTCVIAQGFIHEILEGAGVILSREPVLNVFFQSYVKGILEGVFVSFDILAEGGEFGVVLGDRVHLLEVANLSFGSGYQVRIAVNVG